MQNQIPTQKQNRSHPRHIRLKEKLSGFRTAPSFLVLSIYVLLIIFKLVHLCVTDKTVENLLMIPFQLFIFFVPFLFFLANKKEWRIAEIPRILRFRMLRVHQIPLLIFAILVLVSGTMLVSLVFAGNDSLEEGFTLYNTFVSRSNGSFWSSVYLILAYAIIPAICEEIVFRAVLCREYEKYNVICGVIASAVFFALLHFNVYQFPVYFFSGILLAMVMYATGSVLASIIVHLFFNIFGLFGQPYLNAFYALTGGTEGLFLFILCMMTIFFAALFCTFASKSYAVRAKNSNAPARKLLPSLREATYIASEIFFTPFAIAAICLYIAVFIVGFLK